jgi:vacuolar-type H+-ATPase subunit C/Vma6
VAWHAVRRQGLPPGLTDERIWRRLLDEVAWLYGQMDRSLRRRVAPVLELFELKTIVLCVRDRAAHRATEVEGLLAGSLLSGALTQVLRTAADVRAAIAGVTGLVASVAPPAAQAASGYAAHGLRGFEDGLVRGYLAHVATRSLDPAVARFFAAFTDLRNVMILYKQLHWDAPDALAFVPGGALGTAPFATALAGRTETAVAEIARRATGLKTLPPAAGEGALETVLLSCLAGGLRGAARGGEAVPVVLDYLWRRYAEARNSAVLLHAASLDPAVVERELIA